MPRLLYERFFLRRTTDDSITASITLTSLTGPLCQGIATLLNRISKATTAAMFIFRGFGRLTCFSKSVVPPDGDCHQFVVLSTRDRTLDLTSASVSPSSSQYCVRLFEIVEDVSHKISLNPSILL